MGVAINELLDVIKKSGLPLGDKLYKTEKELGAEDVLRTNLQKIYQPQMDTLDQEKKKKIQALANVDRQFSQLFGQGGKYQLRNPMDAEQLTQGGHKFALSDLAGTAEKESNLMSVFEKDISKANSLYEKVNPTASGSGDGDWFSKVGLTLDKNGNVVFKTDVNVPESDWEIDNVTPDDGEWELITQNKPLIGRDRINQPLG
jgi:hypothetical protein